jgi:hypothetical protein
MSELYRTSDRCLSAKLVPTVADRGCHVLSMTDPYSRILALLEHISETFVQNKLILRYNYKYMRNFHSF